MEEIVADVFAEVLGREDIGIDDDFFAAGGHSLAALKVLALIKARTGITLQALDFFQRPAVRDIAACAEKRNLDPVSVSGSDRFVIELRAHGKGSPLYILPGGWGEANEILVFARLLSKLKSDRPIYAVRSRVADESRLLPDRLEQQAADVLRAIAAVSGDRSIVIVGECAASAIAIAVAAQADAQGRVVDAVILLDPGPLSHLRSVADRVAPVPVKIGLFSRLRSWVVRLAKSSSTVEAPQQPNPLPPRVAAYYRLLGSWEPRRVRTPLHLILSSRFPDVDGVRQSWMSLAQGPLYVHRAKGDHNSYIRERASDLAGLLASIVSESPMRDDSQQFLL
jgi:acyl carrier protein/surfactin synthase thioesterase subunit